MKKKKLCFWHWIATFSLSDRLKSIDSKSRKSIIMDQLIFDQNTEESINLFEEVRIEFKNRMEIRNKEAIEINNIITKYYNT